MCGRSYLQGKDINGCVGTSITIMVYLIVFLNRTIDIRAYKPRPSSLESVHIGEYLQEVVALDALVFVGIELVLRIQYKPLFTEVWVTITLLYRFVFVKQRNPPNSLFVSWVMEPSWRQNRVDVFLPKPSTIKKNAVDIILVVSIAEAFVTQDAEAELLQIAILGVIWMAQRPQVGVDDTSEVVGGVGGSGCNHLLYSGSGVGIVVEQPLAESMVTQMFYGVAYELGDVVVAAEFPCTVSHLAEKTPNCKKRHNDAKRGNITLKIKHFPARHRMERVGSA